ncbi:putative nitronate monooxygenase [Pseudolycoriella hygida]|uniref:Nitronate monooxygenase n=1 Tax=Pseudolycoriella hygida TaxID=35572 RepID=A0A9Q0RTR3_9DIPT|nr:putative nitronate monooxygenase [Pseudolycoriella hygida]
MTLHRAYQTSFTTLFGCSKPFLGGPMAGFTTDEMVIETCNAGGIGSLAAGRMQPNAIRQSFQKIASKTNAPFAVNLFIPTTPENTLVEEPETRRKVQEVVNIVAEKLGDTDTPPTEAPKQPDYSEQIETVLELKPSILSWTFGIPSEDIIRRAKKLGIKLIGTATSLPEAIALKNAGVDAITIQGSEAGGHRGSFLTSDKYTIDNNTTGLISLLTLVRQVIPSSIPLIAAGGIVDKSSANAAFICGASAVQCGTALLVSDESTLIPNVHKELLLAPYKLRQRLSSSDQNVTLEEAVEAYKLTGMTRAYTGKPARSIYTEFMKLMRDKVSNDTLPWTIQDKLTAPVLKQAAAAEQWQYMTLWAGQSYGSCEPGSVKEIISRIIDDTE